MQRTRQERRGWIGRQIGGFGAAALGLMLVFTLSSGCGPEAGEDPQPVAASGGLGTLLFRLTLEDDVQGFHFEVWDSQGELAAQRYVGLERENAPAVPEEGIGAGHRFADSFFLLPVDDYEVRVSPMRAEGEPSEDCAPAEAAVGVVAGQTVEVELVSRCGGEGPGGLDLLIILNHPPELVSAEYAPSKWLETCEPLTIVVAAEDPDGDPVTYAWTMLEAPDGGSYDLDADGTVADFLSDTPGDYALEVTVCDSVGEGGGACTSLVLPIHVQEYLPLSSIAYWRLDEAAGDVAADSVGDHDGTLHGPTWQPSPCGAALAFDGEQDWVELGPFEHPMEGTYEVWFQGSAVDDSYQSLLDGQYIRVGVRERQIFAHLYDLDLGRFLYPQSQRSLDDGRWYHVALTWQPGEVSLYLDGELVDQQAWSGNLGQEGNVYVLGADWIGGRTYNFAGLIDNVAMYDRALDADEVTGRFEGGRCCHWNP